MAAKRRHVNNSGENGKVKQGISTPTKSRYGKKKFGENGHATRANGSAQAGHGALYIVLALSLAGVCGVLHRNHIAHMFESDRHFSHLSSLERELAFRTEMGLYYSYFKTMISAPSVGDGLRLIMYDNVTEHGLTINTLKRFNLYPEVLLGVGYRVFEWTAAAVGYKTKTCWQVNRGQGMTPVSSCEGLGDPAYFYIENVFLLNGLNMAVFFLFGTYLSGSLFGGVLAVVSFFYNHGECTRVQWTPPLRESFAYPFLVLQMFLVTRIIRMERPGYAHSVALALATAAFMLPWQFAQFALMTQTVAVFGTYFLLYIGSHKMKVILLGQGVGLLISYVFLFGNEMLITSFFAACLLSVYVIVLLEGLLERLPHRIIIWAIQLFLLAAGTLGIKYSLSRVLHIADDKHIADIFRSKFTDFANFHTMLYTCAAEFDFMERETPFRLLRTLLIPSACFAISALALKMLKQEYSNYMGASKAPVGNGKLAADSAEAADHSCSTPAHRSKPNAELLYHVFQLLAFTAMAVIIMRLKLFWTPHLCLITSLLPSPQIFGWLGNHTRHAVVLALLACMSIQGYSNLSNQWSVMGEFSNYPLEEVVEWINRKTTSDAVFAGPMPTMATVKLCTGRPIVNHPHYEDAGLRERTKKVYTMYSRKPAEEVWRHLRDLDVHYVIAEMSWCQGRSRPGCGMAEIWDLEDKENVGKLPMCHKLSSEDKPYFKRVFRNKVYDILKVLPKPASR